MSGTGDIRNSADADVSIYIFAAVVFEVYVGVGDNDNVLMLFLFEECGLFVGTSVGMVCLYTVGKGVSNFLQRFCGDPFIGY